MQREYLSLNQKKWKDSTRKRAQFQYPKEIQEQLKLLKRSQDSFNHKKRE